MSVRLWYLLKVEEAQEPASRVSVWCPAPCSRLWEVCLHTQVRVQHGVRAMFQCHTLGRAMEAKAHLCHVPTQIHILGEA